MPSKSFGRILILCKRLPNPRASSGELRFWHIINILNSCCRNLVILAEDPVNLDLFPTAKILTSRSLKAAALSADIAVLEFWYMYPYLQLLKKLKIPTVIDSVDIEYLRFERAEKILGRKYKRLPRRKAHERQAYRMADTVWAVTEDDATLIRKDCSSVSIVPNIHALSPRSLSFRQRSGIVFIGSFKHQPNIDALRWYRKNIFPYVADLPHTILGHDAPKDIQSFPGFVGGVKESTPYIKSARVSIAPLRYGAGMKGKIGEAFSNGTPVVTTKIGAEGYPIEDKIHFILENDPKKFAASIRELYINENLWRKISKNSKKVVFPQRPNIIKKTILKSLLKTLQKYQS